jgi:hypothetical protein
MDSTRNIAEMIAALGDEMDQEKEAAMTDAERRLSEVARKLLLLERDLTVPGASASEANRIDRLMKVIEEEDFQ